MVHVDYLEMRRACLVCGHEMEPSSRICDKCGSIRRTAKPLGHRRPAEKTGACRRCGEPVPERETLCETCARLEKERRASGRGRLRRSLLVMGALALLCVTAGILAIAVFGNADVFIATLIIAALVMLACGIVAFRALRKSRVKATVYHHAYPRG